MDLEIMTEGVLSILPPMEKEEDTKRSRREIPASDDDRIGGLPDSVLIHILSFLPMEDAIKTHLLSKRWQYLWSFVPSLLFRPHRCSSRTSQFVSFVDKALVICGGGASEMIKKLTVEFDYKVYFKSNVDLWTRFAARNKVEELDLNFYGERPYILPQHMYTNSELTKLSLSSCSLVIPIDTEISWKSLKTLSIGNAEFGDIYFGDDHVDVIPKILAGCPVLECLELYRFRGIKRLNIAYESLKKLVVRDYLGYHHEDEDSEGKTLEIWAPFLHSLDILGCFDRNKCRLTNVVSLMEANLNFSRTLIHPEDADNDYEEHGDMLRELLKDLHDLENLTLGTWSIQVLSTLETKGLLLPLPECKCLTLNTCMKKKDLSGIASLLEISPNLETLIINMDSNYIPEFYLESSLPDFPNSDEEIFWTLEKRIFMCLLQHLKTVKIVDFVEGCCALGFIQFLLKNARVLEKMIIKARNTRELFHAAQKLLSFPRSSPHAVVLFLE